MIHESHVCLGCGHTKWRRQCSTCETIEITLIEIIHKEVSLSQEIYSLLVLWTWATALKLSVGRGFYKNSSLKGHSHICEIPSPISTYISTFFVDHHPNKPPSLKDMTKLHVCKHYYLSKRLKWSSHVTQKTLTVCHTTQLWTCHFDNFIRPAKHSKLK